MSFKILIVEDEELFADQLEMLVDKLDYEHLATVDNSTDALIAIQQEQPDLILMDVHIRGTHDGIQLADLIHKTNAIPIIFITSLHDDSTFARASQTNPINFLLKPFNSIQLQRTIELTVKKLEQTQVTPSPSGETAEWENDFLYQDHFFIKTRQKLEKVAFENILYLESDGHYTQVHTTQKKFLVRLALSKLVNRLPEQLFVQTHRSFFVNIKKIQSIDLEESVISLGDKSVPLSKRNREDFLQRLDRI